MIPATRPAHVWTAAALALLLGTPWLGGAMMHHYDLSSLVVMSQYVVLAEHVGKWDPGASEHTFRVRKVYRGAMLPGETITVQFGAYDLTGKSRMIFSPGGPDEKALKLDPEAALFLVPDTRRSTGGLPSAAVQGGPRRRYWAVGSGVRVIAAGTVYRFEQWNNPGPYVPVPQGRDPHDVRGVLPPAPISPRNPVNLETFEKDLFAAIRRVARYERALSLRDTRTRREALLEVLGPTLPLPDGSDQRLGFGFYRDAFAAAVIDNLAKSGDFDGALEAVARSWKWLGWPSRLEFGAGKLVDAARDRAAPAHRRAAALWSLGQTLTWGVPFRWRSEEIDTLLRLEPILDDPEPGVRRAAVEILGRFLQAYRIDLPATPPEAVQKILTFLAERWVLEEDGLVRDAIVGGLTGVPGASEVMRKRLTSKSAPPVTLRLRVHELIRGVLYALEIDTAPLRHAGVEVDRWSMSMNSRSGGGHGTRSGSLDGFTTERGRFLADLKARAASDEESRKLLQALERRRLPDDARVLHFKRPLGPGRHTITVEANLKDDRRRVLRSEPHLIELP